MKEKSNSTQDKEKKLPINGAVQKILIGVISVFVLFVVIIGIVFFSSPSYIRYPEVNHYHMRMQLLVDGKEIDLSESKYQEAYDASFCNDGLTDTPIHLHDSNGQVVHIHWGGLRGGDVLKYYGLNRLGGLGNSLGIRFDSGFPKSVPIHGDLLPKTDKTLYIFEIKNGEIIQRDSNDFLKQDLETFFGIKSTLTQQKEDAESESKLELLSVKAYAHDDNEVKSSRDIPVVDNDVIMFDEESKQSNTGKTQEELKKLNDILGDIIVFAQDSKPTDDEVKARIPNFIDLEDSQCGG